MTAVELALNIKLELIAEMEDAHIPVTISGFEDLHRYCDANQIGDQDKVWGAFPPDQKDAADALVNEARTIVDVWIKSGGLR